ncbi:MAG: FkbM family methyltransferase [Acidobacteria bacterium]|nr:FkbM family methyltransferase [Acidobacteriota bacterium]
MKRIVQFAIFAVPLFALVFGTRQYSIAAYRYLAGKTGGCSFPLSMEAATVSAKQAGRLRALAAGSRVMKREGQLVLMSTPRGQWWISAGSEQALYLELAEQERDIYRTGEYVQPGNLVLDCGANIGIFARTAINRGARVIAIEPVPITLEALRRNLKAETEDGRLIIYPKGIWDKNDVLHMNLDEANHAADSFIRPRGTGTTLLLPLTTIDAMVEELHLERVDFIKMDIEGAERRAVVGARETIRRHRPRMALCLYHLRDDPAAIHGAVNLIDRNYQSRWQCEQTDVAINPQVAFFY